MNRTVLITGASGGIGRAAALRFAKCGYAVGIGYNESEARARELLDSIAAAGGMAELIRVDVPDEASANAAITRMISVFGHLDSLVCCAGISMHGLLQDMSYKDWRRIMAVNTDGAFNMAKAAISRMTGNMSGSIVFVSSIWGVRGASCEAAYSASKAAVEGLSRSLAREVGPSGVRVNCVCPGFIDTDMNARLSAEDKAAFASDTPLCRIGTPDEAAAAILFLASEDASFITGQSLAVDGGYIS